MGYVSKGNTLRSAPKIHVAAEGKIAAPIAQSTPSSRAFRDLSDADVAKIATEELARTRLLPADQKPPSPDLDILKGLPVGAVVYSHAYRSEGGGLKTLTGPLTKNSHGDPGYPTTGSTGRGAEFLALNQFTRIVSTPEATPEQPAEMPGLQPKDVPRLPITENSKYKAFTTEKETTAAELPAKDLATFIRGEHEIFHDGSQRAMGNASLSRLASYFESVGDDKRAGVIFHEQGVRSQEGDISDANEGKVEFLSAIIKAGGVNLDDPVFSAEIRHLQNKNTRLFNRKRAQSLDQLRASLVDKGFGAVMKLETVTDLIDAIELRLGNNGKEIWATPEYVALDENAPFSIAETPTGGIGIATAQRVVDAKLKEFGFTGAKVLVVGYISEKPVDPSAPRKYSKSDAGDTPSQEIARDVGASSRAIQVAQPGTSSRDAEIEAIRRAAAIPWISLETFGEAHTVASEHQIWFKGDKVIKATAYGKFGHSFDGPGKGTPLGYLRRIAAANEAFSDSATIIGKFVDAEGNFGLVHAQDFILGDESKTIATEDQIIAFLEANGFSEDTTSKARGIHVNAELGIEVSDFHPGNFVVSADGKLVPIDVLARKFDPSKGINYSIRRNAAGQIEGYFDPRTGEAVINASAISSPKRAVEVLLHELVGHGGIAAALKGIHPAGYANLLTVLQKFTRENGSSLWADVQTRYPGKPEATLFDEALARLAENPARSQREESLFRAILNTIRQWLAKAGITNWSDADIDALIRRAADAVRQGEITGGKQGIQNSRVGQTLREAESTMVEDNPETPLLNIKTSNTQIAIAAASVVRSWPKTLVAADGSGIDLAVADKGSIGSRVFHLIREESTNTIHPGKAAWLSRVPETLQNAQVRIIDSQEGTRIFVRKYEGGINHAVVIKPDGSIDSQNAFTGHLETHFPILDINDPRNRQKYMIVDWVRPDIEEPGLRQTAPRATPPDSTVSGPRQEEFQGSNTPGLAAGQRVFSAPKNFRLHCETNFQ